MIQSEPVFALDP